MVTISAGFSSLPRTPELNSVPSQLGFKAPAAFSGKVAMTRSSAHTWAG